MKTPVQNPCLRQEGDLETGPSAAVNPRHAHSLHAAPSGARDLPHFRTAIHHEHQHDHCPPSALTAPAVHVNRRAYYRGLQEGRPQPLPYADFETSLQPGGVRLVVCLLESAPELTGLAEEATRDILGALPEGACHHDGMWLVSVVEHHHV